MSKHRRHAPNPPGTPRLTPVPVVINPRILAACARRAKALGMELGHYLSGALARDLTALDWLAQLLPVAAGVSQVGPAHPPSGAEPDAEKEAKSDEPGESYDEFRARMIREAAGKTIPLGKEEA